MNIKSLLILSFLLLSVSNRAVNAQDQKFADLGDFKLENGQIIRNLKFGYRTFGTMNAERSNIIVFPIWAGGQTSQLNLKPSDNGKLIDTSKYFVIAIDPLSNGVSSSPSNSKSQPRMKFPGYTMRDVVNSEYDFLTRSMGISHVKCIMGVSMGGMQTFQWMVSYPDFMDLAIPMVGSPQLAPYDLLHWQTQIDVIMDDPNWRQGDYKKNPAREFEYEIGSIILTTPDDYNRKMTREKVFEQINKAKTETGGFDANDKIRQDQAMMSINVTDKFGSSWERAAAAVKAKTFVIVARFDHTVTPSPALRFADLLKAKTLVLQGDCGHMAPSCESEKVNAEIAAFLDNN